MGTVERLDSMKKVIQDMPSSSLDEGFLKTVESWMNKSKKDGKDGMVGIFQKVLQIYAGVEILRARKCLRETENKQTEQKPIEVVFDKLLCIDTDNWNTELSILYLPRIPWKKSLRK